MTRWQLTAVPPQADSWRIFYLDPTTGEMCFRPASWKAARDFLPNDGAPGIGVVFDPKTGAEAETGKVYPSSELE
jgi:hypothetical protein